MKYSIIFWIILIVSAVILCQLFPIIEHDVITYLIFVYVLTRFWKYFVFRRVPRSWRLENEKTAIVTGSSSGIGSQIAQQLCSRGAKVVWAARDDRKARTIFNDVEWTPCQNGRRGYVAHVDLASLKSIEKFVEAFKSRERRLDILVLNAAYHGPYRLTSDGFEQNIGVDHLGHMYLCYLLIDLLKSSADGRIVCVTSDLHRLCKKVRIDDLMFKEPDSYTPWAAYNHGKMLNILFVKELSRRLTGTNVAVHAAHPGTPVVTELMRDSMLSSVLIGQFILRPLSFFYCRSPAEAAQTPLYCALSPEWGPGKSGKYFENCRIADASELACDAKIARDLWDKSCDLLNIPRDWI